MQLNRTKAERDMAMSMTKVVLDRLVELGAILRDVKEVCGD